MVARVHKNKKICQRNNRETVIKLNIKCYINFVYFVEVVDLSEKEVNKQVRVKEEFGPPEDVINDKSTCGKPKKKNVELPLMELPTFSPIVKWALRWV